MMLLRNVRLPSSRFFSMACFEQIWKECSDSGRGPPPQQYCTLYPPHSLLRHNNFPSLLSICPRNRMGIPPLETVWSRAAFFLSKHRYWWSNIWRVVSHTRFGNPLLTVWVHVFLRFYLGWSCFSFVFFLGRFETGVVFSNRLASLSLKNSLLPTPNINGVLDNNLEDRPRPAMFWLMYTNMAQSMSWSQDTWPGVSLLRQMYLVMVGWAGKKLSNKENKTKE